jgi:hypothetical protein
VLDVLRPGLPLCTRGEAWAERCSKLAPLNPNTADTAVKNHNLRQLVPSRTECAPGGANSSGGTVAAALGTLSRLGW